MRPSAGAKRLAALVPYTLGTSPGQRVRIESWARYLERAGWTVDFLPFEDEGLREVLYRPGGSIVKARRLLACYARQVRRVLSGPRCDVLFIYKEAALVGPALLERATARLRVPIVYDLDDPFFLAYRSPFNGWLSLLKFPRKTHALFRLSTRVIAVNGLLADYAASYNPSVTVVPNCVDTDRYRPAPRPADGTVRLVWVGSRSTMPFLTTLAEPLRRLQSTHRVAVHVIAPPEALAVELPGVDVTVVPWSPSTEVADIQACDIGLVPVPDYPWNRWKFPFKALQYMALGIPVVGHRRGSAEDVVDDGVNGFLVGSEAEWYDRLGALTESHDLRDRMGRAARAKAVASFSTQVQMPRVVSIFDEALRASG